MTVNHGHSMALFTSLITSIMIVELAYRAAGGARNYGLLHQYYADCYMAGQSLEGRVQEFAAITTKQSTQRKDR